MTRITLMVDETSSEMAHQLLALAIKKKYKNKIRPCYEIYEDDDELHTVFDHDLQNDLWRDACGQFYDY